MRTANTFLLAGGLALAAGLAVAAAPKLHTMTVALPDGSTARIVYAGNVPPHVTVGADPVAAAFYAPVSPFAQLQAISAEMDREMDAMMRLTEPVGNPLMEADLRNMPAGAAEYSMISTMSGDGQFCSRSTRIVSSGPGERPKVVTQTSGNCGESGASVHEAPAQPEIGNPLIEARARSGRPAPQLQEAAYRTLR
jgi:hypothetical protein